MKPLTLLGKSLKTFFFNYCGIIFSFIILVLIIRYPYVFLLKNTIIVLPLTILLISIIGWRSFILWKSNPLTKVNRGIKVDLLLSIITSIYFLFFLTGGVHSPLSPLLYLVAASIITFWEPPEKILSILYPIVLELLFSTLLPEIWNRNLSIFHILFLLGFGFATELFKRVDLFFLHKEAEEKLKLQLEREEKIVKDFRLMSLPILKEEESPENIREKKLIQSIAREFETNLLFFLEFIKKALNLYTVALYWVDTDKEVLTLKEILTDYEEEINSTPLDPHGGVIGGIFKKGEPLILSNLKNRYNGIPFYKNGCPIKHFIGLPIKDKGEVQGVVCCDRIEDTPFTGKDLLILESCVFQILKAIENERIFVQLEKTKNEQAILYKATKEISSALSEDEVMEASFRAITLIVQYDFGAITLYDSENDTHTIAKVIGLDKKLFEGQSFKNQNSLVSLCIKTKHYLPYKGKLEPKHIVFDSKLKIEEGINSILVIPLISRNITIGTLSIASRKKGAFSETKRNILQVIANQLAVSLSNAMMVEKLKNMATKDGLTGLYNRRTFMEQLELKLASARRFKHKLSLILTDLDHFKSINDTYGHSIGDEVLRRFAKVLTRAKRETDLVARYGGEEFAIICEQTDELGAKQLAERIRQELSNEKFITEIGEFKVSCSLGVACYPDNADSIEELINKADTALYKAKELGRNQVVLYSLIQQRQSKERVSEKNF